MEVRLKVLVGKNVGHEIVVAGDKFLVGREEDCHLRPRSDLISRHHCAVLIEGSYLGIRDFGSKNGTYVNGQRVVGEQELNTGDRLKVGPLEFEVVIVEAAKKKLPKVASVGEAAARTALPRSGQNGASSDVDIDQFLGPDDSSAGAQETRVIVPSETTEIPLASPPAKLVQPAPVATTAPAEPEAATNQPAGPPKRNFAMPAGKQVGTNSKDAASDVLKKFFKRR